MSSLNRVPKLFWLASLAGAGLVVLAACGGGGGKATPTARTPVATSTPAAKKQSPTAAAQTPTGAAQTAQIKMLPGIKFDKAELTIAANVDVTVTADNTAAGISHSFAVYKSKADADAGKAAVGKTKVCTGPCKETVTLKLAAGQYFFRCEVHPTQMTGTLIVK